MLFFFLLDLQRDPFTHVLYPSLYCPSNWSSPGKQVEAWHRSEEARWCPPPEPVPSITGCSSSYEPKPLKSSAGATSVIKFKIFMRIFVFLSQFKIVNMRCCWRRLDLRPQHSFADFQRSLISGCEGASRGHFPAGERRSGPPSCMPGTAVWKPESWRMYSKLTSHNVWWYLRQQPCASSATFASLLETGFTGNWTSVALSMVFSCRISCCDWLWPKGWKEGQLYHQA